MKKWFKTSSIAILVSIFLPMLAFSAAGDFTPQRDGITLSHNNGLGTGSSVEFNRFTDDTFYAQQKGHIPGELAHQEALAFAVQNGLQDHLDQRDFLSIRTSGAGLSNRYLHGVDDLKQGDRILVNVYVNNNATQACGGVNPSLSTRAQIDWGGEDGKILGAILSSNASPTQINDKVDVSGTGGLDFRYLSAVVIERENPDGSPDGSACGSRNTRFQARNVTATVQGDTAQVDLGSVGGGYGHAKFVVFELEVVANNARPLRVSRNISIAASTLKNNAIVSAGTEFSYNVKVENVSGETINNVVVTDTLDSHLEFVVGTGGVSHNGNTITLQYGNIAAQSSATLNYTVRVKAATANGITFCTQGVATADTPGGLSVTENCPFCTSVQDLSLSFINTIHVCGNGLSEFGRVADQSGLGFKINGNEECDDGNLQDGDQCNSYCRSDSLNDGLVVTLEAIPSSGTTLERGDTIDYILTVTNNFQRDVTGIIIGNPLPNGVTYVGAIDPTTPGIIVHANGTVTVNVGDLVPGESKAFRYQVRIDGDAPFGPIVNRATVNAAHVLDNNGNSVDLSGLQSNPVIHFVVQDATPVCGNHRREAGEQCDDGNTASNDGCSSTCQVENPQNCGIDGNGDGNLVDPGEECDDGGTVSGDGCNNLCQLEGGICGNGVTEQISCPAGLVCATVLIVEQCDD
ncbi:MAG TPA: DUF4215 domain-containing protein, partial [Candidatus Gracilibacteria bacterium]